MNVVKIKSYAKINMTLDILGVADGYHLLDSFVTNVDLYNLVVVQKRKDKLVSGRMKGLKMDGVPFENTNACKVAEKFVEKFQVTGADVTVYENIPVGAGLGGSSADAAGVLRALSELYEIPLVETYSIANECGSDIRYMLEGGYARMRGRGEKVELVENGERLHLLLLCPDSFVSAKDCYCAYDRLEQRKREPVTERAIELYKKGEIDRFCALLSNDLFEAAKTLDPNVAKAYEELQAFSPLAVVMTGSGSCVFAIFENREFCEWAKSRYRGKYRAIVAQTVGRSVEKIRKNPFSL